MLLLTKFKFIIDFLCFVYLLFCFFIPVVFIICAVYIILYRIYYRSCPKPHAFVTTILLSMPGTLIVPASILALGSMDSHSLVIWANEITHYTSVALSHLQYNFIHNLIPNNGYLAGLINIQTSVNDATFNLFNVIQQDLSMFRGHMHNPTDKREIAAAVFRHENIELLRQYNLNINNYISSIVRVGIPDHFMAQYEHSILQHEENFRRAFALCCRNNVSLLELLNEIEQHEGFSVPELLRRLN